VNDDDLYTDILVQIMTGKNNLIAQCEIYEAFPITLGAIEYSQQETDMTYAMCEVGFAYSWFDVKPGLVFLTLKGENILDEDINYPEIRRRNIKSLPGGPGLAFYGGIQVTF